MTSQTSQHNFHELALAVIETEATAISALTTRINDNFSTACRYLLACKGRIVVLGMGKSGHIANKIAATFASTGSPAFFVHPAEASHGDLGMVTAHDVVVAISNSGNTTEICTLLPMIKRLDIPLITLTGNPHSTLAQHATVNLDVSVQQEACPLGLAPTASTTAALVMGDALAIALLQTRGFSAEDFARAHPGGQLGQRLIFKVADVMHQQDELPIVTTDTTINQTLTEITQKQFGISCVVDQNHKLVGVFTDGDLRRILQQQVNLDTTPIHTVMSPHCKTIHSDKLADEALNLMEQYKITSLVVINQHTQPIGLVHMHTLLAKSMGINA